MERPASGSFQQKKKLEIRLSGSGGQGLLFAGKVLAEAFVRSKFKHVILTESFGPEARGGASKSDIIVSNLEIYYPRTRRLDILLALSQEACDEYSHEISEGGVLLVDSWHVKKRPPSAIALPLSELSRERFNTEMFANMIAVGVLSTLIDAGSMNVLVSVLETKLKGEVLNKNTEALRLGADLVRNDHSGVLLPSQDSNLG